MKRISEFFGQAACGLKAAAVWVTAFFDRNTHRRNVLMLSAVYCVLRALTLQTVEKGGDAIWKWQILRLWCETGTYPAFPPDHHQGRWMLMLPVRALTALFGADPWVYYIYPLAMGLTGALAVYFIASRLRSRAAGAAAFALTVFSSFFADETMQLCPMNPGAAFTMLAVLAMLRYFDTRRAVWTLAAGVLLGLGYGCKVTIAYWYLPFALGLWLYGAPEAERRTIPWRPLLLLALGGAAVAALELWGLNEAFGVRLGRISMITSGHLRNRPDPQYMDLWRYLLSFLRPLSLSGKFVYTFPNFLLTLMGAASALLWLFRRDAAREKRFAALCFVVLYIMHCYVVYKVFPFLHPERNHTRYLLAMLALGNVLAVCAIPDWRELFGKLRSPVANRLMTAAWVLTAVFLAASTINPVLNGDHLGRVLSHRRLLVRDGRPVLLRLRPEDGVLEHGELKYARMYAVMFAPVEELKPDRLDAPKPWYEDGQERLYLLLWGSVPEGVPCRVHVCDNIFCRPDQLVLKRAKNR